MLTVCAKSLGFFHGCEQIALLTSQLDFDFSSSGSKPINHLPNRGFIPVLVRFPCLLELLLQEFFFDLTPPASEVTMLPQIRCLVSPGREQLPNGEPGALTRALPVSNLCNNGEGSQDLNRKLLCRVPEIPHLLNHACDPVRS